MRQFLATVLTGCLTVSVSGQASDLQIRLAHDSRAEAQTKEQLERLFKAYDVSRWVFSRTIIIDETTTPHSHPVLTLHTRHLHDDELLLATFIHEQLHWFLVQKSKQRDEAIKDLRAIFSTVPTTLPDGANGEESTYLHLLDCLLEYRVTQQLLGELKARQVMEFWATDHYRWVYRMVLDRTRDIEAVITKHDLLPNT